ncbi:hypothetical protein C1701_16900 [Actinoalloteichus sp. AHMU CJ021]|nr:hypothetical protein C1701_16900 [Actinoalloteichus sp. AHMU CJ021]
MIRRWLRWLRRAGRHRGDRRSVSVPELVSRATASGAAVRLAWKAEEVDSAGLVRPYAQNQIATAILPVVTGVTDSEHGTHPCRKD